MHKRHEGRRKVTPDLGDIYNCEKSIHKGVFAFPDEKECLGDFHGGKTEKFLAEVRLYKKEVTRVALYFCEAVKVDKICDENFFKAKDRSEEDKMVRVTEGECKSAVMYKLSP